MNIINLNKEYEKRINQKKEEMKSISARLIELYNMFGYAKNEQGQSLAKRAQKDKDAAKMYEKLIQKHPKEYQEMNELEQRWGQLAEEVGMWG